jgi:hypothetical protein
MQNLEDMQAELLALSDLIIKVEAVKEFLDKQGKLMGENLTKKNPVVYQDNILTISLVPIEGSKPMTKYMKGSSK